MATALTRQRPSVIASRMTGSDQRTRPGCAPSVQDSDGAALDTDLAERFIVFPIQCVAKYRERRTLCSSVRTSPQSCPTEEIDLGGAARAGAETWFPDAPSKRANSSTRGQSAVGLRVYRHLPLGARRNYRALPRKLSTGVPGVRLTLTRPILDLTRDVHAGTNRPHHLLRGRSPHAAGLAILAVASTARACGGRRISPAAIPWISHQTSTSSSSP